MQEEEVDIGIGSIFALKMMLFLSLYWMASMEYYWTSYSIPVIQSRDGQFYV